MECQNFEDKVPFSHLLYSALMCWQIMVAPSRLIQATTVSNRRPRPSLPERPPVPQYHRSNSLAWSSTCWPPGHHERFRTSGWGCLPPPNPPTVIFVPGRVLSSEGNYPSDDSVRRSRGEGSRIRRPRTFPRHAFENDLLGGRADRPHHPFPRGTSLPPASLPVLTLQIFDSNPLCRHNKHSKKTVEHHASPCLDRWPTIKLRELVACWFSGLKRAWSGDLFCCGECDVGYQVSTLHHHPAVCPASDVPVQVLLGVSCVVRNRHPQNIREENDAVQSMIQRPVAFLDVFRYAGAYLADRRKEVVQHNQAKALVALLRRMRDGLDGPDHGWVSLPGLEEMIAAGAPTPLAAPLAGPAPDDLEPPFDLEEFLRSAPQIGELEPPISPLATPLPFPTPAPGVGAEQVGCDANASAIVDVESPFTFLPQLGELEPFPWSFNPAQTSDQGRVDRDASPAP